MNRRKYKVLKNLIFSGLMYLCDKIRDEVLRILLCGTLFKGKCPILRFVGQFKSKVDGKSIFNMFI